MFILVIVVVKFKLKSKITNTFLNEKFIETSSIYKDKHSLIRKNHISEISNYLAGGVYFFDNITHARTTFPACRRSGQFDQYWYQDDMVGGMGKGPLVSPRLPRLPPPDPYFGWLRGRAGKGLPCQLR